MVYLLDNQPLTTYKYLAMIIKSILRLVGDVWKQIHIVRYRNGKTVERQHDIGDPIPEEIREIKQPNPAPRYAYDHHMGL